MTVLATSYSNSTSIAFSCTQDHSLKKTINPPNNFGLKNENCFLSESLREFNSQNFLEKISPLEVSKSFESPLGWIEKRDIDPLGTMSGIEIISNEKTSFDKEQLVEKGYVAHLDTSEQFTTHSDWKAFKTRWNYLGKDNYMKDGGTYRDRSYSTLSWSTKDQKVKIMPYMPLYKASTYNSFAGGIKRYLQATDIDLFNNYYFKQALSHALSVFTLVEKDNDKDVDWFIEVDQYHISSSNEQAGQPTPEGIHSDGTNYFMLMLVDKTNVRGGETTLLNDDGELIEKLTLDKPGDYLLLNDQTMLHGVTPIETTNTSKGNRDILHISFTNLNCSSSIERRFGLNSTFIDFSNHLITPEELN